MRLIVYLTSLLLLVGCGSSANPTVYDSYDARNGAKIAEGTIGTFTDGSAPLLDSHNERVGTLVKRPPTEEYAYRIDPEGGGDAIWLKQQTQPPF